MGDALFAIECIHLSKNHQRGIQFQGAANPLCTLEPNELNESGSVRKGRYEPFLAWRPHFFNLGDLPLDLYFYRGSGQLSY